MDKPIPEAMVHAFVDWLAKEMPPGTYISSPQWWASRIIRQIEFLTAAQQEAHPAFAGNMDGQRPVTPDMARDAERYRFLRGDHGPTSVRWPRWKIEHWTGFWNPVHGSELDAAIDAAMREAKP